MMSHYETQWYRWLRRQLESELGVPVQRGRRRALTPAQESAFFDQIIATRRTRRKFVVARWIAETGASQSTLERVLTEQTTARGVLNLRLFRKEHQNRVLAEILESC